MTGPGAERWTLVGDVGGTNARFARAFGPQRLADRRDFLVRDFATFREAIEAYLEGFDRAGCAGVCIGAAGPVMGDTVRLTNGPWRITADDLRAAVPGRPVYLANDLEAAALSLPHLNAADTLSIGRRIDAPGTRGTCLAVNVGTGFGAATLLATRNGWIAHGGEAGHGILGAADREEFDILSRFDGGAPSVEDVLSGPGLVRLHEHCTAARSGAGPEALSARAVFERAAHDAAAAEATRLFTQFLARVCASLVLAGAAWGGLALFGSVARGWHEHGDHALFRRVFDGAGKMAPALERVPCRTVLNDDAPLIGLAGARPQDEPIPPP